MADGLNAATKYIATHRPESLAWGRLWEVDDEATAELMKTFYEKMLGQEHMTPAVALREAQLVMQKRWSEPYFWAGFILQGDWESSSQDNANLA
jgi:hypothetical protein